MSKKYLIDETTLTNIASAIRTKTNSTEDISVTNFANEILNIQGGEDLSAELAAQEETIAAQNSLISNMMTALEGKAIGSGSSEPTMVTITTDAIPLDEYITTLTLNELIGANCFMIQCNPIAPESMIDNLGLDDENVVLQLFYINGITTITSPRYYSFKTGIMIYTTISEIFDSNTGTINLDLVSAINGQFDDYSFYFYKPTIDTSESDIAYTVYRLG